MELFQNLMQNWDINPATVVLAIILFAITLCSFVASLFRKRFNAVALVYAIILAVCTLFAPVGDILWQRPDGKLDVSSLHVFAYPLALLITAIAIRNCFSERERLEWF